MQTPESLLPAGFGNKPSKKRSARIIDDDEEVRLQLISTSAMSSA